MKVSLYLQEFVGGHLYCFLFQLESCCHYDCEREVYFLELNDAFQTDYITKVVNCYPLNNSELRYWVSHYFWDLKKIQQYHWLNNLCYKHTVKNYQIKLTLNLFNYQWYCHIFFKLSFNFPTPPYMHLPTSLFLKSLLFSISILWKANKRVKNVTVNSIERRLN